MCVALWPCKCSLSRNGIYRLTGREPAAQPGQHASVEMNQAVRDSQIGSLGTDLESRANHPRQAPCLRSCDPAGDSRRISSPEASPAALSSEGATCGRSPSRDAGAPRHGTGTSCRVCIPMSDRPTCLSSTCGLGVIKRFRRAARRQIRLIATASKQSFASFAVISSTSRFSSDRGTQRDESCQARYSIGSSPGAQNDGTKCAPDRAAGNWERDPEGGILGLRPMLFAISAKESSRSQRFQDPFPVGPPAESKFK